MQTLLMLALLASVATAACPAKQLQSFLDSASPGTIIQVSEGNIRGTFRIKNKMGRQSCPIILRGSGDGSTIEGEKLSACLTVENCKHIEISQLSFRSCDTGVVIAKSSAVTADTLWVQSVQKQGIHIKDGSVGCQVSHCRISNTGMTYSEWGFGVQVGRPKYDFDDGGANGEETTTTTLDRCKNNKVIGNKIGPDVHGAGIVIFEGTTGTKVFGNQMDLISSWMLIRGNNNVVSKNMFRVAFKEDSADCIVIDYTEQGQGTGNKIKDNDLYCAKASDYAVTIDPRIKGSNSVCSNAAKDCLIGVSNVCH